jgi:Transposase DDE domain
VPDAVAEQQGRVERGFADVDADDVHGPSTMVTWPHLPPALLVIRLSGKADAPHTVQPKGGRCDRAPSPLRAHRPKGVTGSPSRRLQRPIADTATDLQGEWLDQKHGVRSRRRWRKLHVGVDADTYEIVAADLTPDDVGDVSAVPDLLDQIDAEVGSMIADGAYDRQCVR